LLEKVEVDIYKSDSEGGYGSISRISTDDNDYLQPHTQQVAFGDIIMDEYTLHKLHLVDVNNTDKLQPCDVISENENCSLLAENVQYLNNANSLDSTARTLRKVRTYNCSDDEGDCGDHKLLEVNSQVVMAV